MGPFFFPFNVAFTFWGLFHEKVFYEDEENQKTLVPFSLVPFSLVAFFPLSLNFCTDLFS